MPAGRYSSPTLSTVRQDTSKIALTAVESLLNLISFPSDTGKSIIIPVSLTLRESTQGN